MHNMDEEDHADFKKLVYNDNGYIQFCRDDDKKYSGKIIFCPKV